MSLLALLLVACGQVPTDTTGGTDVDAAIDPDADEDGDGLTNGEEDELGTDFDDGDSDGDGMSDGDEVEAGYNPLFQWSRAYEEGDYLIGGCPDLPDEENAGPSGVADYSASVESYMNGDTVTNIAVDGTDAYEQVLPLYAMCGNYTVITMSAEWCGPCRSFAAEMGEITDNVRKKIPNFSFYEFLTEDNSGQEPDARTLKGWSNRYDMEGIPVVAPKNNRDDEVTWLNGTGYIPSSLLVAPDMTVIWSPIDTNSVRSIDSAVDIKQVIAEYEASL